MKDSNIFAYLIGKWELLHGSEILTLPLLHVPTHKKTNFSCGIYKLIDLEMMYIVHKWHHHNILIMSELDVFQE